MSGIAKGIGRCLVLWGDPLNDLHIPDGTIVTYPEPGNKTAEAIAWFSR